MTINTNNRPHSAPPLRPRLSNKFLYLWAVGLVVGFIIVLALLAHPQRTAAERDQLAEQLVNRLTALDKRHLAICFRPAYCESTHKQLTESIATIQKAQRDGNDAGLRRIAPLVDEIEAILIPEVQGMEEIRDKLQRNLTIK